jgi:aminoglycoside phosphotransferase (APT) family kinase protein
MSDGEAASVNRRSATVPTAAPTAVPTAEAVARLVARVLPGHQVAEIQRLSGGLSNSTYKVRLGWGADSLVLRIYDRDPAACAKEVDLLSILRGQVPVPEVLRAEPNGLDGIGPFIVMRYVEGITFRQLKAMGDARALSEAAYSAGEALAAVGRAAAPRAEGRGQRADSCAGSPPPAWMCSRPPALSAAEGRASPALASRMGDRLLSQLHDFIRLWAPQLAALAADKRLVHGDFNKRNVLVGQVKGKWVVTAILDWEFAFAGSPLVDVASFLRYERTSHPVAEPHFSRGFAAGGGSLPDDWRRLARAVDLSSLCLALTAESLPRDVAREILELIRATLEDRDPML